MFGMSFTIIMGRGNEPPSFASFHGPVLDFREANTSLLGGAQWLSYFFDVLEVFFCAQTNSLNNDPRLIPALLDIVLFLVISTPSWSGCLCVCFSRSLSFRLSLCPLLPLW